MMLDTTATTAKDGKEPNVHQDGSDGGMTALVGDLAGAVGSMASMVEKQATNTARHSHDLASDMIRRQPITAMAVSVGAGMLLAMLMTRTSTERRTISSWSDTADRMAASAGHMAHSVSGTMQSAREVAAPVLPAIERVVDSLSDLKGIPAPLSGLASIWHAIQGRAKS